MSGRVLYKDYFRPDEAADYCCVSRAYFDENIRPRVDCLRLSERKLMFRRADLQRFLEEQWQQSSGEPARQGNSRT